MVRRVAPQPRAAALNDSPPVPLTADLGVPGRQSDCWSFDRRLEVRILGGRGRRPDDQPLRWGLPSTARNPRAAVAQRVRRLEEIVTSIPYLELVKVRDVIRTLERDGWRLDRQVGSHRQFRHPDRPGTVTVAGKPSDEVPKGTLGSIWRQAGRSGRQSGD